MVFKPAGAHLVISNAAPQAAIPPPTISTSQLCSTISGSTTASSSPFGLFGNAIFHLLTNYFRKKLSVNPCYQMTLGQLGGCGQIALEQQTLVIKICPILTRILIGSAFSSCPDRKLKTLNVTITEFDSPSCGLSNSVMVTLSALSVRSGQLLKALPMSILVRMGQILMTSVCCSRAICPHPPSWPKVIW